MNIVFDLGGVVFNWQPDTIVESLFEDERTQNLAKQKIIEHPDWIELDRGTIAREYAIDRGSARTGLPARDVQRIFDAVPRFLTPIEPTIELIRELWQSAHRLFVLSNMQHASIKYLEEHHEIWEMFDGIVISSRIGKVKPEIQIYEHLLNLYELKPAETIFIDDMQENLDAAASLGIQTIRFIDSAQCRQALERSCRW